MLAGNNWYELVETLEVLQRLVVTGLLDYKVATETVNKLLIKYRAENCAWKEE